MVSVASANAHTNRGSADSQHSRARPVRWKGLDNVDRSYWDFRLNRAASSSLIFSRASPLALWAAFSTSEREVLRLYMASES